MANIILHTSNTQVGNLLDKKTEYYQAGLQGAANTTRAYTSDLKQFRAYCEANGTNYLPATLDTIAGYVTHLAERLKYASIIRHIAAISKLHTSSNYESPTDNKQFRILLDGIKRTKGVKQKQAPAFTIDKFKAIIESMDTTKPGELRDKAILLLGFSGAFRRSELASLNIDDLHFTDECLIVSVSKSKTNQYGQAEEKAIFYSPNAKLCPVRSLQKWITETGRASGPLFVSIKKGSKITDEYLTAGSINDIVKAYIGSDFSAHSLRASFVTVAKKNGAADSEIMQQTKHKTSAMIQRYTRLDSIKEHNAALKIGL